MAKLTTSLLISILYCAAAAATGAPPIRWSNTPREIHENVMKGLVLGTAVDRQDVQGKVTEDPRGTELIKYFQTWVDRIDQVMRDKGADRFDFKNIPKPNVMVTKNKNLDAVAVNAPVCFNIKVRFTENKPTREAPGVYLGGDITTSAVVDPRNASQQEEYSPTDHVQPDQCATPAPGYTVEAMQAFLSTYSSCKTTIYQDGEERGLRLVNCHPAPTTSLRGNFDGAQKLVVVLESNWVTLTTGLLATMSDETDVIYTLAHELNHFYSGHLVAPATEYGYFFSEDSGRTGRPTNPQSADLQNWPFRLDGLLKSLYGMKSFSGGSVSGEHVADLFLPVIAALTPDCKGESSAILKCLDGKLISDQPVPPPGQFSLFDIQSQLNLNHISFQLNQRKLADAKNLRQVFTFSTEDLESSIKEANTLLAKERDLRLGHYSFEQDADEKALFSLNAMGISPYVAVPAILRLGVQRQNEIGKPFPPVLAAEDGLRLFVAGDEPLWKKADYSYVHLGEIANPHHTYSHRAKNMFDRAQANHYLTRSVALNSPGSWTRIQELIRDLNPKPRGVGGPGRRPPITAAAAEGKAPLFYGRSAPLP